MGTLSHHEVKNNSSPWLTNLQQVISRLAQKEKKKNQQYNHSMNKQLFHSCFGLKGQRSCLATLPPRNHRYTSVLSSDTKANLLTLQQYKCSNYQPWDQIPWDPLHLLQRTERKAACYTELHPEQRSTKGWCVIDTQNKVLCSWALSLLYWEPLIPLIAYKKSGSNSTNE